METEFVYDRLGRLTDLTHTHDTTTIADYGWTFDSYSRVTQMSFTSSTGNNGTSDYSYDDTGQVTAADHDFQTDESYSYDENGNRTLTGYTTGDNNQLTSDGTFNYTYDDEGNRLTRTRDLGHGRRLHHRVRVGSRQPPHQADLQEQRRHSHQGNRVRLRLVRTPHQQDDRLGRRGGGSAEEIHYVYDGDNILLAFDENGDLTNRYLHGPAVDQILADEQVTSLTSAGDVLWPLNLGSVRDIVDSTGAVENHITYDSFGNVTSETDDTIDHIYAYTGRDRDEESDLQYNRARYYDANVGRWISEDPIGFAAGDSNLARYVGNEVTSAKDPSGHVATTGASQGDHTEDELPDVKRTPGHTGKGSKLKKRKHEDAAGRRASEQMNTRRRKAREAQNDAINDARDRIDSAITDIEKDARTARRKVLKGTGDAAEAAAELDELTRAAKQLREIELVTEAGEVIDVQNIDDLSEVAKEKLGDKGFTIIKKFVVFLPLIGGGLAFPSEVEAHGPVTGSVKTIVGELPYGDWLILVGPEFPHDDDIRNQIDESLPTLDQVDKVIDATEAVGPGVFGWLDDFLDLLRNRF